MKAKAYQFYQIAIDNLNQAKQELFRPEEDLVTYSICKNAQTSIENFLKGYLLQNDVDSDACQSLEALFKLCKTINKDFDKVDASTFDCISNNFGVTYCNDVPKVCKCLKVADNLEVFLRGEKVME